MTRHNHEESGFSLVETIIALGVLTVGALGMASVFAQGLQATATSPNELLATQKAAEAIESVFSARDSRILTWVQVKNTNQGGVFLAGLRPLNLAGNDGLLNTGDTGEVVESDNLEHFEREIAISDLSDDLRSITVTIKYPAGSSYRTYVLTAYISRFA
jgi:type II secretory pathway pseudopilin PulG